MTKFRMLFALTTCLAIAGGAAGIRASAPSRTLVVTMTNDPDANQLNVYDADGGNLLQTLSTHGKGNAAGNARGVRALDGRLIAVVNNGSGNVAIFRRDGDALKFEKVVATSSAPVSVDFANDHMYVAGATTVDSFAINQNSVQWLDGTADLVLAGGGAPPAGSTAQVGAISERRLLVTLKTDPEPGTVDVVALDHGKITGGTPTAVSAPDGSLTPFGFATYPDGTAVIALAHSNQDGLFRDGAFATVIQAGQAASCWMTRAGKYVFVANTGSKTLSRLVGTSANVFVDNPIAASIATGGAPADIDADGGVLGVVDHAGTQSHLSVFTYNRFGELTASGSPITVGAPNANGVAVLAPRTHDQN